MDHELLSSLKRQVTTLGASLNFVLEPSPAQAGENQPPEGTLIWTNSFAVMILVPVPGSNETLQPTAHDAQEWLWQRITDEEKRARFLDGYLLLALSTMPVNALRSEVSQIELDTSVCRKHVIWPNAQGSWDHKLWAVTCLGLPETQHFAREDLVMPALPAVASRALKYYEADQNYQTVADKLVEEAKLAARKNN